MDINFDSIPNLNLHIPKIISLHIPKCVGTSIKTALQSNPDINSYLDYGDVILNESPHATKYRADRVNKQREKIQSSNFLANTQIVHGHFYASKYVDLWDDVRYITCLRKPDELLYSYYYYLKNLKQKRVLGDLVKGMNSFEDFIHHPYFINIMTRLIYPLRVHDFHLIGFSDNFEDYLNALGQLLGTPLIYTLSNVNPSKPPIELSKSIRATLEKLNMEDYEFYYKCKKG